MILSDTRVDFTITPNLTGRLFSLIALQNMGFPGIARLPICLRMILESILRNCDGHKVTEEHLTQLANWQPQSERNTEIPLVVSRILLQDFTGVPLLCDLAAMRSAAQRLGHDPMVVEPRVPLDLVIDHSVQIDYYNSASALEQNMQREFQRNEERYQFIKWGRQAFASCNVVPPGVGIVHQVNLEHLSPPIWQRNGYYFPDSLVGTDSHTTMINGLGVVGWGVGGIEAEAAMLGQPISFLMPDVIGVHLFGKLSVGVTATDLVLSITELLRAKKVVGKFVEYFGEGAINLSVPDRATLANMAPEYGATMGYFPVDENTLAYLRYTGRKSDDIAAQRAYLIAQGMFGIPKYGEVNYSSVVEVDLASITPSVAGPRRPQDRINLPHVKNSFQDLFSQPVSNNGYGKSDRDYNQRFKTKSNNHNYPSTQNTAAATNQHMNPPVGKEKQRNEIEMEEITQPAANSPKTLSTTGEIGHGDILIAAITSCTNTSNPGVMLAAGLLAKKAVERGLVVRPYIKTSLAPGSRVVASYLKEAGLLPYLEQLGFGITAYGCTTCIGNSGPLNSDIENCISENDLVCAAVLSGNRNFEARIHPSIRANYLMSPPLVVAFAIAGRIGIDLIREPLGNSPDGTPVYLNELWPTSHEIAELLPIAQNPDTYQARYNDMSDGNHLWQSITTDSGAAYAWKPSTYIAEPPFFTDFSMTPPTRPPIQGARALAIFGDSLTTDHISPAGAIAEDAPAGEYLQLIGVKPFEFNSYGARRGNHEVMVRGTFANVRIRNRMLPPQKDGTQISGGFTLFQPSGELMTIYKAAMRYRAQDTPTVVFAGEEYGTGSSRDWAAKGTQLLGVKAVIACSFERIHRANLIGMGVLPLQFKEHGAMALAAIRGDELFDVVIPKAGFLPQQDIDLIIYQRDGKNRTMTLRSRLDTEVEIAYFRHGGILPYALRELLENAK